jgi:hypothetical protein
MNDHHPLRVGLFGIGLEACLPQIADLKASPEASVAKIAPRVRSRNMQTPSSARESIFIGLRTCWWESKFSKSQIERSLT